MRADVDRLTEADLVYSFSIGACRTASRFVPCDPKSTSARGSSVEPEVAITVPSPKLVCSTLSPAASVGIDLVGRPPAGAEGG